MMSVSGMAGGVAASYFELAENERSATKGRGDEYYAQGGTSPGTWHGEGARALGLSGTVGAEQFHRVAAGYRPDTGAPGVQNAGSEDRRAGWDLTLSAPKSVSVAMAVANENDREAIVQAHRQAVETAMNYVEREAAFTRRGHAGAMQEKAGLVISRFEHRTSREGDPQLHSHNFVHNQAVRADGSTGTLESRHFYIHQKVAGALYRAELAHQLRERGFEVQREGESFRMSAISTATDRGGNGASRSHRIPCR